MEAVLKGFLGAWIFIVWAVGKFVAVYSTIIAFNVFKVLLVSGGNFFKRCSVAECGLLWCYFNGLA